MDSSNHELIVDMPEPIHVEGDAVRLAQVATNLLSNATRYTNDGGRIVLTLEREGSDAVIRVRDSGIGINVEHMSKIFGMFTEVDQPLERGKGGLGVGLSLTKKLVALH